jgi:ribosomal protein S27AE
MESAMDVFNIALALVVGGVVLFIVKAVLQTRDRIDRRLRGTDPLRRDEITRDLAARIRKQAERVKCTRCGAPTFMLLGTDTRYECEVCHFTFDGPPHVPDPGP